MLFTRLGLLAFFILVALLPASYCGFSDQQLTRCMRHEFHSAMAITLQFFSIFVGVFLGVDVFKNWGWGKVASWVFGVAIYVGTSFFFFWVGFELPHSDF